METSAELLYLVKQYDSKDVFGFTDDLERNEALQWLFFWHGSVWSHLPQFTHVVLMLHRVNLFKANWAGSVDSQRRMRVRVLVAPYSQLCYSHRDTLGCSISRLSPNVS